MVDEVEINEARKTIQTLIRDKLWFCWNCGRTENLTENHVIPQRYKYPAFNITVPLCRDCHDLVDYPIIFYRIIKNLCGMK
jgi:5-methylcytosine-specific restriction endonuclease McrA